MLQARCGSACWVRWFSLAGRQVPTKAAPSLLLFNWRGEKKYNERLMGQDKDKEITW